MNADWDDAPSRVQRKIERATTWLMALACGLSLTVGGLYLAAGQTKQGAGGEVQQARMEVQDVPKRSEEMWVRQRADQPRPEPEAMNERNWIRYGDEPTQDALARSEKSQPGKQTVFSDANFTPNGARNVVPATPVPAEPVAPQKKQQVIVVGKPDPKLKDYCPYAEGSVEHRNCEMQADLWERNRER